MAQNFPGCHFLVCCEKGKEQAIDDILSGIASKSVFTPQSLARALGMSGGRQENSIGHCRNLLQLASACANPLLGMLMLDDDVLPTQQTRNAFLLSFPKYDLVQGAYSCETGNRIYALVRFFQTLEQGEKGKKLLDALCCERIGAEPTAPGLHSLAGGLAGISSRLLLKNAFAPTDYRFEDHFFEFSSRFLFPSMNYMGLQTAEGEIPVAGHKRAGARNHSALVDGFVGQVRASIVESYFYHCLSGCVPRLVGGQHKLVRSPSFDGAAEAKHAFDACAVGKLSSAAKFHLKDFPSGEVGAQLSRLALLSLDDISVPLQELEAEWAAFQEEREWLSGAADACRKGGKRILADAGWAD